VFVKTSAPVRYQAELIDTPARLVIDFEDTDYAWRKTPLDIPASPLMQIRGSQYKKGVARVVVQLERKVGYAIREDDGGLAIVIPTSRQAKAPVDAVPSKAVVGRIDAAEPKAPVKGSVDMPAPQVRVAQTPSRFNPSAAVANPSQDPSAQIAQATPAPPNPPAPIMPAPAESASGRLISL